MITVLLADDQAMVRAGFRRLLELEDGIEVVAEAADGAQAVDMTASKRPDVALLDIRMPTMDGIEATRRIARACETRVVILTTFDLDEYVYEALRAGASGFLLKDAPPEQMVAAIHAA
ncbi:MAG TPA: response regulator transcription factor, partial [Acidimicrobiales bacterium]|nr:response regulator transcription factor [Acidimicrobiales bacterium]